MNRTECYKTLTMSTTYPSAAEAVQTRAQCSYLRPDRQSAVQPHRRRSATMNLFHGRASLLPLTEAFVPSVADNLRRWPAAVWPWLCRRPVAATWYFAIRDQHSRFDPVGPRGAPSPRKADRDYHVWTFHHPANCIPTVHSSA